MNNLGADIIMKQFIRKGDYETTHSDDELIVLNTDESTVTKLNEQGGYCWSLLGEVQTVESLSKAIQQKYGSDTINKKSNIEVFLLKLMEYGLIKNVV
jgi:hypothetical protein